MTDLMERIEVEGAELELSPHTISQTTARGDVIHTQALKVATAEEQSKTMLNGLIEALTETLTEFATSTTAEFKLVTFQNAAINRDGIEELVVRQNSFLHVTTAESVINGGNGDEQFESKTEGEEGYDGSIK